MKKNLFGENLFFSMLAYFAKYLILKIGIFPNLTEGIYFVNIDRYLLSLIRNFSIDICNKVTLHYLILYDIKMDKSCQIRFISQ